MSVYRSMKAVAGLVGGVSPWTVVGILTVLHVHVDPNTVVTAAALASPVLGFLATYFAPKNADAKAGEDAKAAELAETAINVVETAGAALPQPTPR